jgi:hypothetical protein
MFDERTNLHRVVAQTLQWIHGTTSIEYGVASCRLAEIHQDSKPHYSFEIKTNLARISKIRHPFALVAEEIHVVLTGIIIEYPDTFQFEQQVTQFELEDMPMMVLKSDNGGYSTVGVQTKMGLFSGGEEILSRHFLYRNNLLHLIR